MKALAVVLLSALAAWLLWRGFAAPREEPDASEGLRPALLGAPQDSHVASRVAGIAPPGGAPPSDAGITSLAVSPVSSASVGLPDTSTAVTGTATWLCDPPRYPRCTRGYPESSYVAARGSELPRSWQGKVVRVFWRGRHVDVRLVDTCLCKGARILDLYRAPFKDLAGYPKVDPGVLEGVRVELLGTVPLPPTDTP